MGQVGVEYIMTFANPKNIKIPLSILVVDYDKMILELLNKFFEMYGFEVHIAENGLDGWELFNKVRVDIVLTDIQMPGLDGTELAGRIREDSPDTKIAVMTGKFVDAGNEMVRNGIADHCFPKPIAMSHIYETLTANLQPV